jgi:hypothetical protein
MVGLRPVEGCLDELARDTVAAQPFRNARVYEEQTVASASVDKLGLDTVLRPDQAVVSRVAHDLLLRLLACHCFTRWENATIPW